MPKRKNIKFLKAMQNTHTYVVACAALTEKQATIERGAYKW